MKMLCRLLWMVAAVLHVHLTPSAAQEGPVKVEIRETSEGFQLLRGGKPYYIKGVGGQTQLDKAVAIGANAIRTWSADNAREVLDMAHAKGLTVLMGLWVGQERQGFDYNDGKSVAAQLAKFRLIVESVKDHPALLMWGIGNENDLFYSDFKVWNAIQQIAAMVHEVDPYHPTMTVTAGIDVAEIQLIRERAPDIDIMGVNTYGGLIGIDKQMRAYGWPGPYVITEWGPDGHWEVATTSWGAPIEQSSAEKAESYHLRYSKGIAADQERCIGSFVFLWGQKQETTPTWYGLFLPSGESTQVIDELQKLWTGSYPENRAPILDQFILEGQSKSSSPKVKSRSRIEAKATVSDPDGDPLEYRFAIMPESTMTGTGGDFEFTPEEIDFKIFRQDEGLLEFQAPSKPGPYRLFVYVTDGHGHGAYDNIPFLVVTEK